jgi:hypothetical protein
MSAVAAASAKHPNPNSSHSSWEVDLSAPVAVLSGHFGGGGNSGESVADERPRMDSPRYSPRAAQGGRMGWPGEGRGARGAGWSEEGATPSAQGWTPSASYERARLSAEGEGRGEGRARREVGEIFGQPRAALSRASRVSRRSPGSRDHDSGGGLNSDTDSEWSVVQSEPDLRDLVSESLMFSGADADSRGRGFAAHAYQTTVTPHHEQYTSEHLDGTLAYTSGALAPAGRYMGSTATFGGEHVVGASAYAAQYMGPAPALFADATLGGSGFSGTAGVRGPSSAFLRLPPLTVPLSNPSNSQWDTGMSGSRAMPSAMPSSPLGDSHGLDLDDYHPW